MFSTTANFRTRHWTSAIRRAAVYWADKSIRHARSGWVYALASDVARRSRHMARGEFQGSLSSQPGWWQRTGPGQKMVSVPSFAFFGTSFLPIRASLPKKRGGIPLKTMAFVAVKGAYGSAVGVPGTAIIGAWSGESEGVSRAGSARKGLLGATSHIFGATSHI